MIIVDKTGRKLKVGQVVDVFAIGMFQAKVVEIKEQPIILSSSQQVSPHLVLACPMAININQQNGMCPDVYIIAEPDPNDPVVKAHDAKTPRLIKPV